MIMYLFPRFTPWPVVSGRSRTGGCARIGALVRARLAARGREDAGRMRIARLALEKHACVELGDPVPAAERERAVDLAPEEFERPEDAILTRAGDAPKLRAADQNRARAERQRLDDVDAPPEAAVDEHRRAAADRFDDAGQRANRGDRAVELAPAMVGDDDAIGAVFDRLARFARMQQALDQKRPAPLPAQAFDIAPADIRVQLLVHEGDEGADRSALAVIDEGRRGRLAHAHEPSGMTEKVEDAARTPAQREAHAVARIAVSPRHHLIVDGEDA